MIKTKFTVLFLLFILNISAQKNIENSALSSAKQMSSFYNNRDFINYVNYVFPKDYGNDPAKKAKLASIYKQYIQDENDKITIIKVLKTSIINGQYQALFLNRKNNQDLYIFGISNDKGNNWFFTNSFSNQVQFDQIIEIIPTIDTAFSKIVDPKFGKRITYEIGKSIPPFSFTDINGNLLSSDSLKGKIIVFNFWGVGCGPCITEMPDLNHLVEKMKGKEIVFIAPCLDASKEYITDKFLPKHPFNYKIVSLEVNKDDYSIFAYPTHLLIDQNLKVIEKLTGASIENINKIEEKINQLIN